MLPGREPSASRTRRWPLSMWRPPPRRRVPGGLRRASCLRPSSRLHRPDCENKASDQEAGSCGQREVDGLAQLVDARPSFLAPLLKESSAHRAVAALVWRRIVAVTGVSERPSVAPSTLHHVLTACASASRYRLSRAVVFEVHAPPLTSD